MESAVSVDNSGFESSLHERCSDVCIGLWVRVEAVIGWREKHVAKWFVGEVVSAISRVTTEIVGRL